MFHLCIFIKFKINSQTFKRLSVLRIGILDVLRQLICLFWIIVHHFNTIYIMTLCEIKRYRRDVNHPSGYHVVFFRTSLWPGLDKVCREAILLWLGSYQILPKFSKTGDVGGARHIYPFGTPNVTSSAHIAM